MKELGEKLSELRKSNSVTIEEASHDLSIDEKELQALENGNLKAFKDVYELKNKLFAYSKYLGISEEEIDDEFNDYLFEKTSKISKLDINKIKNSLQEEEKDKISSPYTKIKPTRYDFAPLVLLIVLLVFISLIVYLILSFLKNDDEVKRELKNEMEICYELTK